MVQETSPNPPSLPLTPVFRGSLGPTSGDLLKSSADGSDGVHVTPGESSAGVSGLGLSGTPTGWWSLPRESRARYLVLQSSAGSRPAGLRYHGGPPRGSRAGGCRGCSAVCSTPAAQ